MAKEQYEQTLQLLTLDGLASMLSAEQRSHYAHEGWVKMHLDLTPLEVHVVKLMKAVQGAELGIVTTQPSTHRNAVARSGFDSAFGWVR